MKIGLELVPFGYKKVTDQVTFLRAGRWFIYNPDVG